MKKTNIVKVVGKDKVKTIGTNNFCSSMKCKYEYDN